jgi:plastocyanin
MSDSQELGGCARRSLLRRALGVGIVTLIGAGARKAVAEQAKITIDNFTFSPALMITSVGSTVTWVNEDDTIHSIVCPTLNIKSQPLDTDDTFSHVFDKPGMYDYVCGLHPHMHGQVLVQ